MPRRHAIAQVLADALLAGTPGIDEFAGRCAWVLGRKHRWIKPLCRRIFHRFGSSLDTRDRGKLIEAIRTVHRGEVFLYPAATKLLVDGYLDRSTRDEEPFDGLTEREREVLKLVAEGFSGTEIAEQLIISPKTVDTYRERIMQKLGVRHRYELVRYALRKGMLKAE